MKTEKKNRFLGKEGEVGVPNSTDGIASAPRPLSDIWKRKKLDVELEEKIRERLKQVPRLMALPEVDPDEDIEIEYEQVS